MLGIVDMYYIDLKSTDAKIYEEYTGGYLEVALENLKYLLRIIGPEKVVVRIPIIPGFADREEQQNSKEYLRTIGVRKFDLFDYKVI